MTLKLPPAMLGTASAGSRDVHSPAELVPVLQNRITLLGLSPGLATADFPVLEILLM